MVEGEGAGAAFIRERGEILGGGDPGMDVSGRDGCDDDV